MKYLKTTLLALLTSLVSVLFSAKERTSCTFIDNENYYELQAEFSKEKCGQVFEIVNKHTQNVFNLSIQKTGINEKRQIGNKYFYSIQSSNKSIKIKALKNENDKSVKFKMQQMHSDIKKIIN